MHGVKPAKKCPANLIGLPIPNSTWTGPVILLRRMGPGKNGSGPSGWKMRPAAQLARSVAHMAAQYRSRKKGGK